MRFMVCTIIFAVLITGCVSHKEDNSNQTINHIRSSEGIVLAKLNEEGKRAVLIAEDVNNQDLLENLQAFISLSTDQMLANSTYDLKLLDLREISEENFNYEALQAGTTIQFSSENEFLMTNPPTIVATEVNVMDK